jgi:molybdopterin synthase catalytic subunit
MRSALVSSPLDLARLVAEVSDPANGASILFVGTVRDVNDGRAVTGIDYSAYVSMAERELAAILDEAATRFGTPHLVVEHRLGTLAVGDASIAIAVAHPRRGAAYDASRFIIEEIKRRVPIWKREHYTDGTREWVDPTRQSSDPRVTIARPAALAAVGASPAEGRR